MSGAPVCARASVLSRRTGPPLGYEVHLPPGADPAALPVAVLCHGFKGFRRWGMFPHVAGALARAGRAVVLMDFSRNGVEPGGEAFTRPELFREQTPGRHADDVRAVLDALAAGALDGLPARDPARDPVHLVGHSLGGGVALLVAAGDPRIGSVALLNGVGHLQRIGPDGLAQLERDGHVDIVNARTGQLLPLGRAWFDEVAGLDLHAVARRVRVPVLSVIGGADTSVPPDEQRALAAHLPQGRVVEVPGADHTFGARHPWAGWTEPLRAAAAALDDFLPAAAGSRSAGR